MIYLDNAATTLIKPECVIDAVSHCMKNMSVNAGRGSYTLAKKASSVIDDTRQKLNKLAGCSRAESDSVIFTPSATIALNIILNGIELIEGDIVYVSPFEHNAIMRTLKKIETVHKIIIKEIPMLNGDIAVDMDRLKYEFESNRPKCICMSHISNTTGFILPIEEIDRLAKSYESITIIDASQSFGLIPIDVEKMNIDYLVFAGHKSLYGPFGIAGFIKNTKTILKPYITGGTGSDSLNLNMPKESYLRYEAGSENIVAIAGLAAAITYIESKKDIFEEEKELSDYLVEGLRKIPNVILYVPKDMNTHIKVVSFNIEGYRAEEVGMILDMDFDIAVRTGYHCAPLIHKHLHDEAYLGTVRASVSIFNSKSDIDTFLDAISQISSEI